MQYVRLGQTGLKVVRGQGVIVLPLVHKVGKLHLSARQINVQLSDAVTKQGIKVAVQGVATVKIGSDDTIYAMKNGVVKFSQKRKNNFNGTRKSVNVVSVV